MLYKHADDFFKHADGLIRDISREKEKEYALKMKQGDEDAKAALTENYLPVLAAYLKKYISQPSLQIIYMGIGVLDEAILSFDFQSDNPAFTRFLETKIRSMIANYIAIK